VTQSPISQIRPVTPLDVAAELGRGGSVPDAVFDTVFPARWRRPSKWYWTPVDVARLAARWLEEYGATAVLDVGSGVGKVCLVGALCTRTRFCGLEQRSELVDVARSAAMSLGVGNGVSFVCGEVGAFDLSAFDAFYFYNPFGENLYSSDGWLDRTVEMSQARFDEDTKLVEEALDALPVGTRMVTYHGMGGRIPDTFALERAERVGTDVLRLWVKRRRYRKTHYVETSRGAVPVDGLPGAPSLEQRLWGEPRLLGA
jgi:predicted RNA methylase